MWFPSDDKEFISTRPVKNYNETERMYLVNSRSVTMGNYLLCTTMFIPLMVKSDSLVPKISDDVACVCCATEQHDIHFGLNSILFMKVTC